MSQISEGVEDRPHAPNDPPGPLRTLTEWVKIEYATSSNFYSVDSKVYFKNHESIYELGDLEASTTRIGYIQDGSALKATFYAKDDKRVYRANEVIEKADIYSFTIIADEMMGFSKDIKYVFVGSTLIEDLSTESVVMIDKFFLKDHNTVYYAHPIDPVGVIVGADPSTFEVLPSGCTNSCRPDLPPLWLRDKSHVFFANEIVTDADPETFVVLNQRFGKDNEHVYCMTKKIQGADTGTFTASTTNVWAGYDAYARYDCDSVVDRI